MTLPADPQGPAGALAFKLLSDRHKGRIVLVRVNFGSLHPKDELLNARTGNTERVARLPRIQADKEQVLELCSAGEIAAVVGFGGVRSRDPL